MLEIHSKHLLVLYTSVNFFLVLIDLTVFFRCWQVSPRFLDSNQAPFSLGLPSESLYLCREWTIPVWKQFSLICSSVSNCVFICYLKNCLSLSWNEGRVWLSIVHFVTIRLFSAFKWSSNISLVYIILFLKCK